MGLFEASKTKLEQLDQLDKDRAEHETALNELQSFVFDVQDKLYQEEYEKASTDEEREKIRDMCSETSDWLDEEAGPATPTTDFKEKLKVLKELTSALFARVREHTERPEALEALDKTLNSSKSFLEKSRLFVIKNKTMTLKDNKSKTNLTGDDEFFKEKELDQLSKKIEEIEKWQGEKTLEQSEHPLSEMPKLTVSSIVAKIHDLESEVKFLVSQAKMRKAEKEREKRLKEAEERKA